MKKTAENLINQIDKVLYQVPLPISDRHELEDIRGDAEKETMQDSLDYSNEAAMYEALSSGDWAKVGGVLGILWYKFDKFLDGLRGITKGVESIDKEVRAINRKT